MKKNVNTKAQICAETNGTVVVTMGDSITGMYVDGGSVAGN